MIGAGGYYDPPGMPGLADTTASLMDEGTTTKSSEQIAQALDTMAATVAVSASAGSQIATRNRVGAHGSVRRGARAGVGHPAESELSGKGTRPVQGARPRGARRTAQRSELPEAGAVLESDLRQPSGIERRTDARVAREDDARGARRASTRTTTCPITPSSACRATSRSPKHARNSKRRSRAGRRAGSRCRASSIRPITAR